MNDALPTVEELKKLPVRALITIAARAARRVTAELRSILGDDTVENALRHVDSVAATDQLANIDRFALMRAGEHLVAAYSNAPASAKSPDRFLMLFSLIHAELVAVHAIEASLNTSTQEYQLKQAAEEAERSIRTIRALPQNDVNAAAQEVRQDYESLLGQTKGTGPFN